MRKVLVGMVFLTGIIFFSTCSKQNVEIINGNISFFVDRQMHTKIDLGFKNSRPIFDDFVVSDFLITKNYSFSDFDIESIEEKNINDSIGTGFVHIIKGSCRNNRATVEKVMKVSCYDKYPDLLLFDIYYVNKGKEDLLVEKWVDHKYNIKDCFRDSLDDFWSFQGSTTAERGDWVKPVNPGFFQENYMGMNDCDYGGGTPVVDLWRQDVGLAIGQVEMVPKEISLPVYYNKYTDYATLNLEKDYEDFHSFSCGDTLRTIESFISVHQGDYFSTLRKYSNYMQDKGIKFIESEPGAFEPVWCGWGYERTFTKDEIIGTLPKVKELGIKWAVVDDGFQIAEGDWRVNKKRFSKGSQDMKDLVEAIHQNGLKAKLWWAPLAADPGSKILQDDPLVVLINREGAPQYITWWDSYYLSPAYQGTIDYTKETVTTFLKDWGFDGLKCDGQHMNAVPPEFNWSRPLDYPEKSIEKLPEFFKTIYETARSIKPHAVVEHCPCGTCMSFYNMPYTNQFVSSDPLSSWQIRLKGKTYKAIAPQTAYYGDHVELSDSGSDFASSFGIGAVLGTKFTWPKNNPDVKENYLLTPEKEVLWKKWFSLYNKLMLSKGEYLGDLYDIGYDKPETHVIKKDGIMYFAFYNDKWKGNVSFRGLKENTEYKVVDYFNNKEIGNISNENPVLYIEFNDFCLIKLLPVGK